jgi:DNA-binding transcriptional ArsR family regulator
MPPERRLLLIDVNVALEVRREVGPVGWLVLEAIASLAPPDLAVVEVACSARSLSELIGLSKDTVARSLRPLIEVGIVARVDHRHELSGRFLSTTYRVDLSTVGISVLVPQQAESASSPSAPTRSRARNPAAQLSLLS